MENQENFTFNWLRLWQNRKEKSMDVAKVYALSQKEPLVKKAQRVSECGNWLLFDSCKTMADKHTKRLKAGNFCDDRLCQICNKKRAIQLISSLMPVLEPYLEEYKIIFMTLTIRSVKEITKDVYKKLMENWSSFQRDFLLGRKYKNKEKQNYYDGPCIGGVATVETTYNKDEKHGLVWHPHMHGLLICKKYISQKKASEYWKKVTGDSKIVSFEKVKFDSKCGLLKGVVETVKYLAKLNAEMPAEKIVELALALRSVRCINAFGVLRGFVQEGKKLKKQENKMVCSKCGSDLINLLIEWYDKKYISNVVTNENAEMFEKLCCNRWQRFRK